MKRKLSDREIEEVQPDQKTAKIDEEEEDVRAMGTWSVTS